MSFREVTHAMVGFNGALVKRLDALLPPASVLVLEEPDVVEARKVRALIEAHPCVAELILAATQDEPHAEHLAQEIRRPRAVRAVLPGVEYGVVAAAALADAWGVPGASVAAARTLRNKAALRRVAQAARLPQPAWREARSPDDVAEFRSGHGGRCVLKPANRQASVGVLLLGPDDDPIAAWEQTTAADEPHMCARYALAPSFLVEQRLDGPEVSVESLVHAGLVGFKNVTGKSVQHGASPVEIGHVVPAPLPQETIEALGASVQALVDATDYRYGVLHSEWILVDGRTPHLIECAARLPGDNIDGLIELAYGAGLSMGLLAILEGRGPVLDRRSEQGAAIRFLTAPSGRILAISGVERAETSSGVQEVQLTFPLGAVLPPVNCSWHRPGYVVATGRDGSEAAVLAIQAASQITISTE